MESGFEQWLQQAYGYEDWNCFTRWNMEVAYAAGKAAALEPGPADVKHLCDMEYHRGRTDARSALLEVLRRSGFTIRTAPNGFEFLLNVQDEGDQA